MSPTSYQTAPPRALMITTASLTVKPTSDVSLERDLRFSTAMPHLPSLFHLRTLTGIDDLRGINRCAVHLLFQNTAVFADQEIYPAGGFVLVHVDAVLAGGIASPVTEEWEGHTDGVGEGFIGEGAIHAHTQDLGVGSFQLFQILLEVFHLLGSTTGESENVKRQHHLFLPAILVQCDIL